MSRLIDADELEKVMTEDWFLENLAAQDSKSAVKKDIVNMIDSVPLAEEYDNNASVSKMETVGWIPCSERLPEQNKDGWTHLILSIKTGEVIFGFWHNEEMGFCKHFRDGVCRVGGVIAWMLLPEPYKPEGE